MDTQWWYYVRIYCLAFHRARNTNRGGLTDLWPDRIMNKSSLAQMVKKQRNISVW